MGFRNRRLDDYCLRMERVTGIGGFFFAARDPESLAEWYSTNLGVDGPPTELDQEPWAQQAGETVFSGMTAGSSVLAGRSWSINFRVSDLDAMVGQLRANGIEVAVDAENYPYGRFARLTDPEGNGIELWEPTD